jgi:hypothetical protein
MTIDEIEEGRNKEKSAVNPDQSQKKENEND